MKLLPWTRLSEPHPDYEPDEDDEYERVRNTKYKKGKKAVEVEDDEEYERERNRKGKKAVKVQNVGVEADSDGDCLYDSDFDSDYDDDNEYIGAGDDDLLYSKNTDPGAEWIRAGDVEEQEPEQEHEKGLGQGVGGESLELGDDDLLLSEDDFPTYVDVDGDVDGDWAPIYVRSQNSTPAFALGMIFSTKKEFRQLVDSHAIIECRPINFTKSDKHRCYARCMSPGCTFKINLRKRPLDSSFEITTLYGEHTCEKDYNVRNMNSNWLAERYGYQWKGDTKRKVEGFRESIVREVRCHVSWWQAYLAKRKTLKCHHGDGVEQYGLLWNYANEITRTNPGSSVFLGVEQVGGESKFSRFYICLAALKVGFLRGCRKIFGVDGTFLKGPYGGILLTAVGVDPNNNLYPIAWAVVNKEDGDNWEWFLRTLKTDLNIVRDYDWVIISDKQKGLVKAVHEVFPDSAHRFCVSHMHSNFQNAGFRGHAYKIALWKAAKASTLNEFGRRLEEIKRINKKAFEWLKEKNPEQWSRSHFGTQVKCDLLLNNICESFNSKILPSRELPILSMLESIMSAMMKRVRECRERGEIWKGPFCPRIKKILDFNYSKLPDFQPFKSSNIHYQISCFDGTQYAVDLEKMTCGCRKWDLTGIPCKHAVCAINCGKLQVDGFVHKCYRVETYREAYRQCIMPMNGRDEWEVSSAIPPLPPKLVRQAGRPPKARRREQDEEVIKRKRKVRGRPAHLEGHKKKRHQETLTCGRCSKRGHNQRSCIRREETEQGVGEDQNVGNVGNVAEADYVADEPPQMEEQLVGQSQMVSQLTQEMEIDDQYLREVDAIIKKHIASQASQSIVPQIGPHKQGGKKSIGVKETGPQSGPKFGQHRKRVGVKIRAPPHFVGSQPFPPPFEMPEQRVGPIIKEGGMKYLLLSDSEGEKKK